MKTNKELKIEIWNNIHSKIKHLDEYYNTELMGIEDDSVYFHPTFVLDENSFITSQCDINNKHLYALRYQCGDMSVDIYDDIFEAIVIGYSVNKDRVMSILNIMIRIKDHSNKINGYIQDFIHNQLIGNSIEETTKNLISELKIQNEILKNINNNGK